jgi:hypothetical protein
MKNIRVKDAFNAISKGESFKASDFYGMVWQPGSDLYPIARRIERMLPEEREQLLQSMKLAPESVSPF